MNDFTLIFQGLNYIYEKKQTWLFIEMTLRDPIDSSLLQEALNLVLAQSDYFNLHYTQELSDAELSMTKLKLQVCAWTEKNYLEAQQQRKLLYVAYRDKTVYLGWHHFLTDGRGARMFLTQIISAYCNLKEGTKFALLPLQVHTSIPVDRIMKDGRTKRRRDVICSSEYSGPIQFHRIRLFREDVIRMAQKENVKPFSYMLAVLMNVLYKLHPVAQMKYSYPVDVRSATEQTDALYNAACAMEDQIVWNSNMAAFSQKLNEQIVRQLTPAIIEAEYVSEMYPLIKLHRMKASLDAKRRAFEVSQRGTDVFFSYIGKATAPEYDELEEYISDCWFGDIETEKEFGMVAEAFSIGGNFNLCIMERLCSSMFEKTIVEQFEIAGIKAETVAI